MLNLDQAIPSVPETAALRRLIVDLANQCKVDLRDEKQVIRLIDAANTDGEIPHGIQGATQELSSILRLYLRLESGSSEDTGYSTMMRLKRQQQEYLSRYDLESRLALVR